MHALLECGNQTKWDTALASVGKGHYIWTQLKAASCFEADHSASAPIPPQRLGQGRVCGGRRQSAAGTVAAIREVAPERLIIADGARWAKTPCPELGDLGIAQSCRGYRPRGISHYNAPNEKRKFPLPTWPGAVETPDGPGGERKRLEEHYEPWAALARQGVGVHCGKCGAFNYTPHDPFLRWLRDVLDILTTYGIGYALWNFRGPLGVMDSDRQDVAYENWHGHKLDRKLLELLREY